MRSHPDGIALLDDCYQLLFANAQYLRLWGFSEQSAFRMTGSERFEHQVGLLAYPEKDAFALRLIEQDAMSHQSSYFHLKDGRWFERIAYRHIVGAEELGIVSQWRDVTGSHLENLSAQHERDLMHSMMDSVPDQIFFKDRDSRFIRINTSLAKRYGLDDPAQAVGKSDADFYSAEHAAQTMREELEIMRTGAPVFNQLHHEVWHDGREAWNVSMKMPLRDANGGIIGTYGIAHDITEHKKAEALIWQQANFDALTGLPNRRMLRDRWEQVLNTHKRHGHGLGLLIIDLDQFKEVNDSLGHAFGDQLLVQVSRRVEACLRSTDTLARMGGDEFAVILTDLLPCADVGDIAQKIVTSFGEAFDLGGHRVFVSASIGVALYPQNGESFDELLKLADQAMYEAKSHGRNGFCFFTSALQERAHKRLRMASDLHVALEQQQFHLVYQPVVNLRDGSIHKAEALIRWQHPQRGLIPPCEFIPLAESMGLINEIGDWVFHTAAQQVRLWRSELHPDMQIAVNKSPLQFQSKNGPTPSWADHLKSGNIAPEAIVVEITEGLLLDASESVQRQLLSLRQEGMRVSLDDFGTGYSSLAYLHRFDIDFLKIDQSFMRDLAPGSKNLTLCKAIIQMAHELGMQVVAEGIETQLQKDLLQEAGCDFGQGYFFAKPLLPEDFLAFARSGHAPGH
ncbi:bifunctional diguanylate cyclase/phosphodiesterase [Rhodoferax sp. U11-2br]|uniref:putative bifunctional diguanylate cyclase/phosphodiesterase n=1 Tax=Rhodoferax sp. U11-2br TaxID=2838878 RepID=UPI001BECB214|nr:EAL domain-containing protein [Rhodoferax sp. U11-2br]MBT3065992.1 EAL domain-containing protein [Rhodoferax sp. U11-2br]